MRVRKLTAAWMAMLVLLAPLALAQGEPTAPPQPLTWTSLGGATYVALPYDNGASWAVYDISAPASDPSFSGHSAETLAFFPGSIPVSAQSDAQLVTYYARSSGIDEKAAREQIVASCGAFGGQCSQHTGGTAVTAAGLADTRDPTVRLQQEQNAKANQDALKEAFPGQNVEYRYNEEKKQFDFYIDGAKAEPIIDSNGDVVGTNFKNDKGEVVRTLTPLEGGGYVDAEKNPQGSTSFYGSDGTQLDRISNKQYELLAQQLNPGLKPGQTLSIEQQQQLHNAAVAAHATGHSLSEENVKIVTSEGTVTVGTNQWSVREVSQGNYEYYKLSGDTKLDAMTVTQDKLATTEYEHVTMHVDDDGKVVVDGRTLSEKASDGTFTEHRFARDPENDKRFTFEVVQRDASGTVKSTSSYAAVRSAPVTTSVGGFLGIGALNVETTPYQIVNINGKDASQYGLYTDANGVWMQRDGTRLSDSGVLKQLKENGLSDAAAQEQLKELNKVKDEVSSQAYAAEEREGKYHTGFGIYAAAFFLDIVKAYNDYRGIAELGALFMDEDELAEKRAKVNEDFCKTVLLGGTQCWASKICAKKIRSRPGEGSLVGREVTGPGGLTIPIPVAHVEAERSLPIESIDESGRAFTQWLYRWTFYIRNPSQTEELKFNVVFSGPGVSYSWWPEVQTVDKGGVVGIAGTAAIPVMSSKDYRNICIVLNPSVRDFSGDRTGEVCNVIKQYPGGATAPYPPSDNATGGTTPPPPGAPPPSPTPGSGF